jgi:hypothetical protein
MNMDWTMKTVGSLVAAAVAVPTIAGGFYTLYQVVTLLGN